MCSNTRIRVVVGLVTVLNACASDQPGVGTGSGELGKGSISLVCTTDDAACSANDVTLPSVTPIAVGASFALRYEGHVPRAPNGDPTTMTLFSASPAMLSVVESGFVAWTPGNVAVIARTAEGTVTDFAHLRLERIQRIRVEGRSSLSVDEQETLVATPLRDGDGVLAGIVSYTWQVEGDAIEVTQSAGRTAMVLANHAGTATLRVQSDEAVGELEVTVEDSQ